MSRHWIAATCCKPPCGWELTDDSGRELGMVNRLGGGLVNRDGQWYRRKPFFRATVKGLGSVGDFKTARAAKGAVERSAR